MADDELLIRHAIAWAETKKRFLDPELLTDVLDLRRTNDELPDGEWPHGSAERLLLVTWPAYGPPPPDPDALRETLDTYWGFLRATGRMSAGSASPAELRKEAKRSLPKMEKAYDDPARHSQGRVLGDFARSIGLELDGADSIEELRERLAIVQQAWNALPQEERIRRMPDPSPKGARGQTWTRMLNDLPEEEGPEEELRKGELPVSARQVREAPFVRQCLALADWVGSGREVTQAGLLRPAVAREAYDSLGLWPWEREHDRAKARSYGWDRDEMPPEADAILARSAQHGWHSAGDWLPLDRLWFAIVSAGLVEVGSRRAKRTDVVPDTDEEWRSLGLVLVAAMCQRLGSYVIEPIMGVISIPALADAAVPMGEVRDWWDSRCPPALRDLEAIHWQGRLDLAVFMFDDCNLFTIADDQVSTTEFGRDAVVVLTGMHEQGMFDEDVW